MDNTIYGCQRLLRVNQMESASNGNLQKRDLCVLRYVFLILKNNLLQT